MRYYDPAYPATGCHRALIAHDVALPRADVVLSAWGDMAWVVWVGALPVVTCRGRAPGPDALLLRDYNGAAYVFWAGVLRFAMPARARLLQ
jgi:hypothetical protein